MLITKAKTGKENKIGKEKELSEKNKVDEKNGWVIVPGLPSVGRS